VAVAHEQPGRKLALHVAHARELQLREGPHALAAQLEPLSHGRVDGFAR
jgi:hypothetical protein